MSGTSSLSHGGAPGREVAPPQEKTDFDKDSTRQTVTSEAGVLDIDLSVLGSHESGLAVCARGKVKKQTTSSGEKYDIDLFNFNSCQFNCGDARPVFLSTDLSCQQVGIESPEEINPGRSCPEWPKKPCVAQGCQSCR